MPQVLGIVGSPRYGGNTSILIKKALDAAASVGVTTKQIELAELKIEGCGGCFKCTELGHCIIRDELHIIVDSIKESGGVIFGSPAYFGSVPPVMKCMIDRIGRFVNFKGKVGGAFAVGRRSGVSMTIQELHFFMFVKEMIIPGIPAWPTGFAMHPGDILSDTEAMSSAKQIGARVGYLVKLLEKNQLPWTRDEGVSFGEDWRHEEQV